MCCAERRRRGAVPRAGFTLVEVLVAVLITGILITVVMQLLQGQGRYVAMQSAREEVQQNARGALDIIASELRSVPARGLVAADSHAVSFALPRAWGVACDGGSSTSLLAVFPTLPTDMFPAGGSSGAGIMADTGGATRLWAPKPALSGSAKVDSVRTLSKTALASSACADLAYQGDSVQGVLIRGSAFPDSVPEGNLVMIHQLVRYDVDSTGGYWWVRRSNGVVSGAFSQQPLAGPLPDVSGLTFVYYDTLGTAMKAPGATADSLAKVGRIGIRIATRSRSKFSGAPQYQRDSTTVHLRNQ